ncbi:MAG: arginine--tRNA ligase [Coriobacteriia bacterium]|nr:arginine--tRNA ligase [Coriobacteriia bacterium]
MQNQNDLTDLFKTALSNAGFDSNVDIGLERPKDESNGDFASTVAMRMAKSEHKAPRQIAEAIVDNFPENNIVESIDIAGPGFINIKLSQGTLTDVVERIRSQKYDYGCGVIDCDDNINLEYISANPTGPMHVGHGRWAALGDSIARIMKHAGYNVYQEFYVNDHGVQMQLFANSIYVRYRQIKGEDVEMPDDGYGGDYVKDIAQKIYDENKNADIDFIRDYGYKYMMDVIKHTLAQFGNEFDMFFSESSLYDDNLIEAALDEFKSKDLIYERDGATWFKSTEFGDDKDRVVIKENGEMTYFLSDCAYHKNKLDRGFNHLIDIWGADHHGYIPRMKAMIQAWDKLPDSLEVLLGQLVNLFRDGEKVRMSKRSGDMITFQELIDEVGVDATRYLMLSRSSDQQIDFDIELAKKQDSSNPVYYVQYAHARICSILRKAYLDLKGFSGSQGADEARVECMPIEEIAETLICNPELKYLEHENELELCRLMDSFPEVLKMAALQRAPHKLVKYSQDLAHAFHLFYTNCHVMAESKKIRKARLALCDAVRITLDLTLGLLGVSAPTRM